jgi:hypothetical protein
VYVCGDDDDWCVYVCGDDDDDGGGSGGGGGGGSADLRHTFNLQKDTRALMSSHIATLHTVKVLSRLVSDGTGVVSQPSLCRHPRTGQSINRTASITHQRRGL